MFKFFLIILSFLYSNVNIFISDVSYENGYVEVSIESDEDIIGFQFQIEASPELQAEFSVENLVLDELEYFDQELTGYDSQSSFIPNIENRFTLFGNEDGLIIGFGLNEVAITPIPASSEPVVLLRIPWTFNIEQSGSVGIGESSRFITPGVGGLPPQYVQSTFTQEYPLSNSDIDIPVNFELNKAFPNPFNPITQIGYGLPKGVNVRLDVYDLNGRHIKSLENAFKSAGYYSVNWDAKDENGMPVSTGMYIYQLIAGNNILSEKVSLIK